MDFYSYLSGRVMTVANDEATDWKSDPFVAKVKDYFGCEDNYFPDKTYEEIETSLEREVTLDTTNPKMSTDTEAGERQVAAVILLIKTGDPEAIRLAHEFGEFLMTPNNELPKGVKKGDKGGRDRMRIRYMAEAALKFRDVIQAIEVQNGTIHTVEDNNDVVGFKNLAMDKTEQMELNLSGQSGDGTAKKDECKAKDPVHCPHHGIKKDEEVDGLEGDDGELSPSSISKMGRDKVLELYRKHMDDDTKPNGWENLEKAVSRIERSEGGGWGKEMI